MQLCLHYFKFSFISKLIMNVCCRHFANPFSFFMTETPDTLNMANIGNIIKDQKITYSQNVSKKIWNDVNHGQYVAVWHHNKWTRGVVRMESQVLIWLIDCGYYLKPSDATVYVDLPSEFKKLPSKVFEASIHGVMPIDKTLSAECEIKDVISTSWNKAAIEKGQAIIDSSRATYFVPVAIVCTKENDVVIGDLYVDMPAQGIVNFIELMELWPVFLQRNSVEYIENISKFYSNRRKHHACILKPVLSNTELPLMSTSTTLAEYEKIVSNAPKLELDEDSCSEDGTVVAKAYRHNHLTPQELEEYSQTYIKFNGIQYNVLSIILNKCHDLSMCEKYKNRKSVGRATTRRSVFSKMQKSPYIDIEDFDF